MQKTILIVDDNKDHAEALSSTLISHKYNILVAHDGQEALNEVKKSKPDLMLLDLNLPKVSGEEVCRQVKVSNPEILIIILSARKKSKDVVHGLKIGADDYMSKPVVPAELLARIEKQFEQAEKKDLNSQEMLKSEFTKLTFRESTALLATRIIATELFFGVVYFLLTVALSLTEPYIGSESLFWMYMLVSLTLLVTNVALALSLLLRWHYHYTEVNKDGVVRYSGIIHKRAQKYVCKFVEIVTVEQTLLGLLLDFGTLELYDPALKELVTLTNIASPKKNGKLIETVISKEQDQPMPFLAGH